MQIGLGALFFPWFSCTLNTSRYLVRAANVSLHNRFGRFTLFRPWSEDSITHLENPGAKRFLLDGCLDVT